MKHKNQINIRPYTAQFYRGNGWRILLIFGSTLLIAAVNLLISWLLQQIIDLVGGADTGLSLSQLFLFSLLSLLMILVSTALSYVAQPRFLARATQQYKDFVFSKLSQKSISAFSGENTALYISALSNDVNSIETGYLSNIFEIVQQGFLFVGALGLMFYYNVPLTLVSIALAMLPLLAAVLTGNLVAAEEEQVSRRNESYMSMLRDSLSGFSVIKSFRAEAQICRNFAREVRLLSHAKEKRMKKKTLVESFGSLAGVTLQLGVFLIGAYLALTGSSISPGTVLIFVQLLNFVIMPISNIPNALAECKASLALIRKLAAALETNIRQEGAVSKTDLNSGITLENLSFGYAQDKEVLHNISFSFEAGKSYCLVGASGSGKSTLLNLLMASNPGYTGEIRYDDIPLQELSSEALYDLVSVVQQNVFIFNASIRENITMFSAFPWEAVDRAIDLSGLRQLIQEKGEDYLCGENGCGLSGGEKQRISIARSLLKQSQVLLVDEATAALDVQTAAQVAGAILDLQEITRIVVTHSLDAALLKRYDCILALKNGVITESGSFDALMEQKGYFYSLYTVSQ